MADNTIGTDVVMLSGETAKGKYPVETTAMMATICRQTDKIFNYQSRYQLRCGTAMEAIAGGEVDMAEHLSAKLIIALTRSGDTVRAVRRHNPVAPILALTDNKIILHQLRLIKGVIPIEVETLTSLDDFYRLGKSLAQQYNLAN